MSERQPTASEEARIQALERERRDAFLERKVRPWEGSYEILARRKQVPSIDYAKADVVNVIMAAFGEMDCPQLDHGAAVALSFAAPAGTLANSGLDPAAYGKFLRASHASLLDWRSWRIIESREEPIDDASGIRETVKVQVSGWGSIIGGDGGDDEGTYDFHLYRAALDGIWFLDVILRDSDL